MTKILAMDIKPLEALPAFPKWTANCKRDRETVVTWHPQEKTRIVQMHRTISRKGKDTRMGIMSKFSYRWGSAACTLRARKFRL